MATGVNVKMGVSGVSKFKQDINAVKQSVKTMDQALALNEKQFKATGDAQEYMATKSELLKTRLQAQKDVIANAEKALKTMTDQGVDKASRAFQEMQRTLMQAQGELIDTEQAMKGVSDNSEDAANNVSEMNTQLTNIGKLKSFETVVSGIGKITGAMEKAASWAWKLGEALVRNVLGAGSYADELKTLSDKTGVDVETLQRMRYTAAVIDTDSETIFQALKKLKKARAGEGEGVMGAFAALDIDPNQIEKAEDLFWAVGEGLLKLDDEYAKEDYAQKLFGKSWEELLPLFKAGRQQYDETMSEWNVVTKEQIDSLGEMDDANQKMQNEWKTFQTQVLAALSGPMKEILDTLTGLLQQFNEYLATPEGKEMLQAMGDAVSGLVKDLVNIDPEKVVEGLAGVFKTITDGFKWLDEHQQDVVNAMKVIVTGWGLLKLTGGALQIFELVSGITGLTAGSAAAAGTAAGTSWGAAFGSAVMKASPFLAFLYTLLNPASSAKDDLDSLWDENGNPTTAGRAAGITGTYDEYNKPRRKGKNTDYSLTGRTGSATANTPRMPNAEAVESTAPWIDLRWETMAKRIEDATENWSSIYLPFTRAGAASGVHMNTSISQEPVAHGGGGHSFANAPTHSDLQGFISLPAEMQTAVMTGVMRGMSNVTIVIDGPEMTSTIGGMMGGALRQMAVK